MSETNKSLRIRTSVDGNASSVFVNLDQSYDTFEILSLKLKQTDVYKLHSANYGVIVGRVLANGNFGVPNAKISIFIEGNFDDEELSNIYPYTTTSTENKDGIRYNLLPDEKIDDCHQVVGTFPNKTYLLDNDVLIEVFDRYYKYTTRTNNSGDYIIAGVPTGSQTLHMDLDLSDCGILSQRPRDFVYKGYTIEQFENANQFKTDTNLSALSQIFSQDQVVNVIPFWGNENQGETIGITRADINITFKFEPTCVFMGSLVADNSSNGISKKCVPTNQMGAMDELTTGEGTIEMIRYTPGGNIEEFQIRGTQLIDGNGVWCYQIPMNLDYMMTDEYGNMVPTDDPSKGIPTRTRVRFRFSMQDMEKNTDNYFRAKVLVPHNPQNLPGNSGKHEDYDYEFGSETREDSFRDLLWNNVYTVKSYIPRFQKSKTSRHTQRFTGIKHCNYYGNNNPMPYNNIRIKLPLMFTILCALIKSYIRIVYIVNNVISFILKAIRQFAQGVEWGIGILTGGLYVVMKLLARLFSGGNVGLDISKGVTKEFKNSRYVSVADGLCPDLENWYFVPVKKPYKDEQDGIDVLQQTLNYLVSNGNEKGEDQEPPIKDKSSEPVDVVNSEYEDNEPVRVCLTIYTDYLIACIEMALAQEYRVINFDFYNDWVNGVIYMPRWMRYVRAKRTFLFGLIKIKQKIKACMDDTSIFNKTRYYVQQCALEYKKSKDKLYTDISTYNGCVDSKPKSKKQKCHKSKLARKRYGIFGGSKTGKKPGNGGIVHEDETSKGQFVYYLKPCEWRKQSNNQKVNLFANDIVLLGSLLECNLYGIPQAFKYLTSSSYIMPTNLALTNMDDEGYLYADGDGVICSNTINEIDTGKTVTQVDNSFSGLTNYYSRAEEDLTYGTTEGDELGDVFDDMIPLTEAAGIAWNYTGPGQGEKSKYVNKSLYMPGGHFLGISCTNAETNIKSCVNLERICEIGSNMSQRREEVRKIVGTTNEFQYRYFVPTGLIANDEVNGGSFRSMFATMNHKRLLCENKYDEKTGYPIYDFIYLRPNGFDGALKNKTKDVDWNKTLNIHDEYSEFPEVAKDTNYDNNETAYTHTRTIEETKEDYYKFRLGLDDLSDEEQRKKFLNNYGTSVSLPQYENSFYFYFGLKDGSTAFDEFLKQFFSVCDTTSRLKNKMRLDVTSEEKDLCSFTSDLVLEGLNGNGIITGRYEYYVDCQEDVQIVKLPSKQAVNGQFEYRLNDLPFGTYKFIISDETDNSITKEIEIGQDVITSKLSSTNFEFRTTNLTENTIVTSGKTLDCGYIEITNLTYDSRTFPGDLTWEEIKSNLVVIENSGKKYFGSGISKLPDCFKTGYASTNADVSVDGKIYVWKADASYDVYLTSLNGGNCGGYMSLGTVFVEGIDNYDLYLGSKLLPYSTELVNYTGEWWRNIGGDALIDWAKRYALYRRTDYSADTFTNKIFAVNLKDKVVDTALFGAPEYNNGFMLKVYYENDNFNTGNTQYSLTDSSLWSTTLSSASTLPNDERQLFGEMAINGKAIVSDKITLAQVTSTGYTGYRPYFVASVSSDKLKDKHGCLVKLDDGTILYCVKDGDNFSFDGEMPDGIVNTNVSIYPIFYYPVINRPFYSKVYIADWINANVVLGNDGNLNVSHDIEHFLSLFDIFNGLTFENEEHEGKKFGLLEIQEVDFTKSGRTQNTDATGTETGGKPVDVKETFSVSGGSRWGKTESNEDIYIEEKYDTYTYTIKENSPKQPADSATQQEKDMYKKLTTPYPIELLTIDDTTSIDLPDSLSYRIDTGANGIRFIKDTNDNNTYYLVKATNPLDVEGYVYTVDETDNKHFYLACVFGPESDKKLKAKYVDPDNSDTTQYINKPGDYVFVELYSNWLKAGIKIPYYDTNKAETKKYKNITKHYDNILTSTTENNKFYDLYDKLTSEYDITPLFTFKWKDASKRAIDVYNTVKDVATDKYKIDFTDVVTDDDIDIRIVQKGDDGRELYVWDNVKDFYVVGFETFDRTNSRDNDGLEKAVNGMGSTTIYRIYDGRNLVQLPSYDSGAKDPYLYIVPSGITGIYPHPDQDIPEPEESSFVWNDSQTNALTIGEDPQIPATEQNVANIGYSVTGYTGLSGRTNSDWIDGAVLRGGTCTVSFRQNTNSGEETQQRTGSVSIYCSEQEGSIGTLTVIQQGDGGNKFYWGTEGTETTTAMTADTQEQIVRLNYRVTGYTNLQGVTNDNWVTNISFNDGMCVFTVGANGGENNGRDTIIRVNCSQRNGIGTINLHQNGGKSFYFVEGETKLSTSGCDVSNVTTTVNSNYETTYETLTTGTSSSWITNVTFAEGVMTVVFDDYNVTDDEYVYPDYPPREGVVNVYGDGSEEPVGQFTIKQGYTLEICYNNVWTDDTSDLNCTLSDNSQQTKTYQYRYTHLTNLTVVAVAYDEEDNWVPCDWATVTINGDEFTVNISQNDTSDIREFAVLFKCEEDNQLDWFWIEQPGGTPPETGRTVTFALVQSYFENSSHLGSGGFTIFEMRCQCEDENGDEMWTATYTDTDDGLQPAEGTNYPYGRYWECASIFDTNKFQYWVPYGTTSKDFYVTFDRISGRTGEGGMTTGTHASVTLNDSMTEALITFPDIEWRNE